MTGGIATEEIRMQTERLGLAMEHKRDDGWGFVDALTLAGWLTDNGLESLSDMLRVLLMSSNSVLGRHCWAEMKKIKTKTMEKKIDSRNTTV